MKVSEATILRIRELSKAQRLSMYELSYRTGMPPSTVKSIKKIAEGLGMTIREFYDCDLFDNLEQDE